MVKLCQRNSGIGSGGLCIFTNSRCGWSTDVGTVEVTFTGVGLMQSAHWKTSEGWISYTALFGLVLKQAGLGAVVREEC